MECAIVVTVHEDVNELIDVSITGSESGINHKSDVFHHDRMPEQFLGSVAHSKQGMHVFSDSDGIRDDSLPSRVIGGCLEIGVQSIEFFRVVKVKAQLSVVYEDWQIFHGQSHFLEVEVLCVEGIPVIIVDRCGPGSFWLMSKNSRFLVLHLCVQLLESLFLSLVDLENFGIVAWEHVVSLALFEIVMVDHEILHSFALTNDLSTVADPPHLILHFSVINSSLHVVLNCVLEFMNSVTKGNSIGLTNLNLEHVKFLSELSSADGGGTGKSEKGEGVLEHF